MLLVALFILGIHGSRLIPIKGLNPIDFDGIYWYYSQWNTNIAFEQIETSMRPVTKEMVIEIAFGLPLNGFILCVGIHYKADQMMCFNGSIGGV